MFRLREQLLECGYSYAHRWRVDLQPWRADWGCVADDVVLVRDRYREPVRVAIFAYSWGAGWGAMRLAAELQRRAIDVQFMVLSDPVYRGAWYWQRWANLFGRKPRTLIGKILGAPRIRVPANVGRVLSFFQTNNWPQGHELAAIGEGTVITTPRQIAAAIHENMDEAPEFHKQCFSTVRQLMKQEGACAV